MGGLIDLHLPNIVVHDVIAALDYSRDREPKDCDASKSNKKWDDGDDERHERNHQEKDADTDCDLFHGSLAPEFVADLTDYAGNVQGNLPSNPLNGTSPPFLCSPNAGAGCHWYTASGSS
jgi:hypothetical protein